MLCCARLLCELLFLLSKSACRDPRGGGGGSTLIRQVCTTGILNLSHCSGVGKPKKDTLLWSYCSFLKSVVLYCIVLYCIVHCIALHCIALHCIALHCIVLYCIVLETKIMLMLYLFYQMILPFPFSSVMFVQKSFKFSITVISLSYDICSAFQD